MTTIDPNREILERLKKLESELGYAADIFQNGSPDLRRSSIRITLDVIQMFLVAAFGSNNVKPLITLRQLIYALHDLDRGKVVPLLTPQKTGHRPPDPIAKEAFIATAMFLDGDHLGAMAARRAKIACSSLWPKRLGATA